MEQGCIICNVNNYSFQIESLHDKPIAETTPSAPRITE